MVFCGNSYTLMMCTCICSVGCNRFEKSVLGDDLYGYFACYMQPVPITNVAHMNSGHYAIKFQFLMNV